MIHASAFTPERANYEGIGAHADMCYNQLQYIMGKIKACDAVLKSRTLDPAIVYIAHRLIAVIEQQLDRLGDSASTTVEAHPNSQRGHLSLIERQLEGLRILCDQLVTTIMLEPRPDPVPVV